MTEITELRVPKTTGTYADALYAVGIASLLADIQGDEGAVFVGDAGHEYVVTLQTPIIKIPGNRKLSVGYPYLAHAKAHTPPIGISPAPFPYVDEMAKEKLLKKFREQQTKGAGRSRKKQRDGLSATAPPPPDARLSLMKGINSLRSGSESWNELAHSIQKKLQSDTDRDGFAAVVLDRLRGLPEKKESIEPLPVSILQVFLPIAGKGTNRPKPDGAKLDNLKSPWVDWFEEWCKYRGVWYTLNARFVGNDRKDLKFMALLPGTHINLSSLRNLADEFVKGRWIESGRAYTDIKSDIFSLLGLARFLLEHSDLAPEPENILFRFFKTRQAGQPRPKDILTGISKAYFKSLGTGKALSNVNTMFLPDWFPVTQVTFPHWLEVLDEHHRVLRGLEEEKHEEASLLVKYRDAISSNRMDLYLDFFSDYGAYIMRRVERGVFTEQFTTSNLEVLIMGLSLELNQHIGSLVKDTAFLAIADAVHEATVKAQYWKGQGQQEYDVHYGLAQQWKRSADRGMEFIHVLSDFVRFFNAENAKRKEKGKPSRDDITRIDLDRVLEYVTSGKVDTRTVCLLLLAYGFAMTDDERERMQTARAKKQKDGSSGI